MKIYEEIPKVISNFKPNTIVVIIDTGIENYQQLIDGVEPEATCSRA